MWIFFFFFSFWESNLFGAASFWLKWLWKQAIAGRLEMGIHCHMDRPLVAVTFQLSGVDTSNLSFGKHQGKHPHQPRQWWLECTHDQSVVPTYGCHFHLKHSTQSPQAKRQTSLGLYSQRQFHGEQCVQGGHLHDSV